MKKSIYILLFVAISCFSSCQKEEKQTSDNLIAFDVFTPGAEVKTDNPASKAEVTLENIESSIRLYGKENSSSIFNTNTLTRELNNGVVTGRWIPNAERVWDDEAYYSFHAFAYNGNGSITVSEEGKKISVVQDGTLDYLLSYNVNLSPSVVHSLVPLHMEHAMANVEIYISRAHSMIGKNISVESLKIMNVYNSATMSCYFHKPYNQSGQNGWSYSFDTSVSTEYSIDSAIPDAHITETPSCVLDVFAIPVDKITMNKYVISISYTIDSTPYSQSFELKNYSNGWISGHKVKYGFVIDNSIHLSGSITDWDNVDYIEGVLIPKVTDNEN